MFGGRQDSVRGPLLDDAAEVHDQDLVGDLLRDGQVVGDEHIGDGTLFAQIREQAEDLRLDREVEGGHRFVEDEDGGLRHERPGNGDALARPFRRPAPEYLRGKAYEATCATWGP